MTFRTKQRVDFWLGGLLLILLFPLVRGLGLLLRRDHSTKRRRGCAVIKLVGAGSLFLANPSLQAVRGAFPPGGFHLVGTAAVTGFAKQFGWFDRCWTIDDSSLPRLVASSVRAMWGIAWECDHLIDLEVHSRLTTVMGVLTGIRNRIGFVNEVVFWRRGFYTHMTYFNVHGPVYVFYDMLAGWFGAGEVPVAAVEAGFRARVATVPVPAGCALPPRYVVVAPGCSEFGKERQLTPAEWQGLLSPARLGGCGVVLLGAAADQPLCDAIIAALGGGHSLAGRLSIAQSAAALAGAERFYGIDSLMLHLARALRVPATSVWGPSDPATRLRPGATEDELFFARMCCAPCIHVHESPPCNGARSCIPHSLAQPPRRLGRRLDVLRPGVSAGWSTHPGSRAPHPVAVVHA